MNLEVAISALGMLCVVIGGFFAMAKLVGNQFERRLDERFVAQDRAREEGQKLWYQRMEKQETRLEELDKDVRKILIELPREYVTRSDYARRETIIEGKIDQLSLRIENWMLGGKNVGR